MDVRELTWDTLLRGKGNNRLMEGTGDSPVSNKK